MSTAPAYADKAGFHWHHLAGILIVACVTVLAIVFEDVVSLYDTALESERLLVALLQNGAGLEEVFSTAPWGQGLIAFVVLKSDGAVGGMLVDVEITHSALRVAAAAFATYACLRALALLTRLMTQDAPWFYSISFTLLVALGPFALLLSQTGVSTMICLASAAPLLRAVFGHFSPRGRVGVWAPALVLIIMVFGGWPGVALALLLSIGCLAQAVLSRGWNTILISSIPILLALGVAVLALMWAPFWPAHARTWGMSHVVLAMGLPFIVVAGVVLAPNYLLSASNLKFFTLPMITMLALVVLAIIVGGNLLAVAALVMLAYATMYGLAPAVSVNAAGQYYSTREVVWAIAAWLIAPVAAIGTYALSAGAIWDVRTIVFSALLWLLCLAALALFMLSQRNLKGSLWALILTSIGAVLFVGGAASVPMLETRKLVPVMLAQQLWRLCRDGELPASDALVSAGVDPLTQRRMGPALRGPIVGVEIVGVDVLHIRHADSPPPEGSIDLVQIRQPGPYIAAIASPSEAALERCGSG